MQEVRDRTARAGTAGTVRPRPPRTVQEVIRFIQWTMNTARYTEEMTRIAIIAGIVAIALALMLPHEARAKAKGDNVGAPVKEMTTGTSRADIADGLIPPAYFYRASMASSTMATSTEKMTRAEKRAAIKELKAEIKRLQKLVRSLTR